MSDYCQLCNTPSRMRTPYCTASPANERSELASATLLDIPKAKCGKCWSENLKDTGSFMVEIHQCQDCGELYCEDSGGVAWDV